MAEVVVACFVVEECHVVWEPCCVVVVVVVAEVVASPGEPATSWLASGAYSVDDEACPEVLACLTVAVVAVETWFVHVAC